MSNYKIPHGISDEAQTGHLNTATLCTVDIEGYKQFYGAIMQMNVEGPINLSDKQKQIQKSFWNIPDNIDYDLYHFYRAAVPSLIHLRVLHLKTDTPHIHNSYNSYELGSFSLGFPTSDAKAFDERLRSQGIDAMAPMQVGDIVRADGVPGQYIETIYKGPDFLHCVGIERVNIPQLAPCDPNSEFCGPGYSALVVEDADREIAFYTQVLDYFTLYDQVWKTSPGSALGIEENTPYRFTGYYAKGAKQNYIISLEFEDGSAVDTGVSSCPPHQGLGMYTFFVRSMGDVIEKANLHEIRIISHPKMVDDPIIGHGRACVLQSPGGMYIELFEL
jgi:hypothetical protein